MRQQCPNCPDGNEWNSDGPTGRACRTCKGKAYVGEDDPPYPFCLHPEKCAGKGYCPRDIACND